MLPLLNSTKIVQHVTQQFGGYDARESTGENGAVSMTNMSSDKYPYASSRDLRYMTDSSAFTYTSFGAYDKLYFTRGGSFYYDGVAKGLVTTSAKQLCVLGPDNIIMPDKKYYRPGWSLDACRTMDYSRTGTTVTFADGVLGGVAATANAIVITASPLFNDGVMEVGLVPGDAVTISGCTDIPANNKSAIIREAKSNGKELYFDENTFTNGAESGTVTVARIVPDMDFICECSNRLWGCKADTIYASALGDHKNFNRFDGISTDSYSVGVGSSGDFTGCISYLGYPVFFKEDSIYKVYGTKPQNYEAMRSASLGVASGSNKSLAIAGETLFYLSRAGVMAYNGGTPVNISAPLGDVRWKNAVGGTDGVKYYISMQDPADAWHLFTYDTRYGIWHREDSTHVVDFAWLGNLYMCIAKSVWVIGNPVAPTGSTAETNMPWSYETGDIYDEDVNKKEVRKLLLRCTLETGATLKLEIKYDSGSTWTTVSDLTAAVKKSYYLPVLPHRCDHYRLKMSGIGAVTLYSLTRETGHGSAIKL